MSRVCSVLIIAMMCFSTCGCLTSVLLAQEATAPLVHSKGPLMGRTLVSLEDQTIQTGSWDEPGFFVRKGTLVPIVDVKVTVMSLGGSPSRQWFGQFTGPDGKPLRKMIRFEGVDGGAITGFAPINGRPNTEPHTRKWEVVPLGVTTTEQLRTWEQKEESASDPELLDRVNNPDWAVGARALEVLRQRPALSDTELLQLRQIEAENRNPEIRLRAKLVIFKWQPPPPYEDSIRR